ncbi:MAG: Cof-type HAD-IIB family hydrolase [Spirochaetaceae bacterium]|jgi:Cof subfamily protein (haloacid dehalogenase superfamily)|nr:Cof-type HAD-IIB family hydrolase [Spirochaetaceae bacterium]
MALAALKRKLDIQQIKAIAVDMDGTVLLPGAELSDRTIAVFKRFMERGLGVIIATGRSVQSAEPFRAALGAEGAMVYFNGAELVAMPEQKILHRAFLPHDIAVECALIARRREIHFHVFFSDNEDSILESLVAENPSAAATVYKNRTGLDFQFENIYERLCAPQPPVCIKGLFIDEPAGLEEIRAELKSKFGGRVNIVKSADTFLEILNVDASKGNTLVLAMKERGVHANEIIAFGDEENDLSMFAVAGFACAPSSAPEYIKAAADLVIASNAENGVAEFLEHNFF